MFRILSCRTNPYFYSIMFKVNEVTKNKVCLSWTSSRTDRGSVVLGYFVEHREESAEKWTRSNKVLVKDTGYIVQVRDI